jgi:hypothetical protein
MKNQKYHTLKHLDDLECHPVFYRRKEIQIILNNEKSKCSSYFLDNFKPELLSVKCHEKYDVNSPEGNPVNGEVYSKQHYQVCQ